MRPQTFIVNQTLIIIQGHHALFMRNHYRWIIDGTHRKRERDIVKWGEREREETEWEYGVGLIEGSLFLVLTDSPKSTQLFLAIATDPINIKLILGRLQIMESTETIYFWRCLLSNGFSGAITSTRITMRFSIQLTIRPQTTFLFQVDFFAEFCGWTRSVRLRPELIHLFLEYN